MTDTLTCYLIDDETPAHVVMSKYIERVPYLTLLGHSTDPFAGLERVQMLKPDVLFLDVEMPDMTGIAFLRSLPEPHPVVVMVTASPQFAAETYNFEAVVHYLNKPVGFDKFLEAVRRVTKRLGFITDPNAPMPTRPPAANTTAPVTDIRETYKTFTVLENKKMVMLNVNEIFFVEGMADYIKIHLAGRTVVTHLTMKRMEEMLPPSQFMRVNRSFIVRIPVIKEVDGNQITLTDGRRVDIGVTYRDRVMKRLKENLL